MKASELEKAKEWVVKYDEIKKKKKGSAAYELNQMNLLKEIISYLRKKVE